MPRRSKYRIQKRSDKYPEYRQFLTIVETDGKGKNAKVSLLKSNGDVFNDGLFGRMRSFLNIRRKK